MLCLKPHKCGFFCVQRGKFSPWRYWGFGGYISNGGESRYWAQNEGLQNLTEAGDAIGLKMTFSVELFAPIAAVAAVRFWEVLFSPK